MNKSEPKMPKTLLAFNDPQLRKKSPPVSAAMECRVLGNLQRDMRMSLREASSDLLQPRPEAVEKLLRRAAGLNP